MTLNWCLTNATHAGFGLVCMNFRLSTVQVKAMEVYASVIANAKTS